MSERATPDIAVFSLKIERGKLDRFKELAKTRERSAAQEFRWLVERELRQADQDKAAA